MPFLLAALRESRHFRLRLIGVDARALPAERHALLDEFAVVPAGTSPDYVDMIRSIALGTGATLIWPGSDEEAMALSRQATSLHATGITAMTSSPECLDLIRDKWAVYRRLETHGLRTPVYEIARGRDEFLGAAKKLGFPEETIVVKPTSGRGGRGVVVLCGDHAPEAWIGTGAREVRTFGGIPDALKVETFPEPLMVMRAMKSPVYDADIVARDGAVLASAIRLRHNPAGIPFTGNTVMRSPAITQFCSEIAWALGLDSLHDYDLMTDDHGQVQLLEVNPRPSGSFVASLAAGLPLADAAIARHLDISIDMPTLDRDMNVVRTGDKLNVTIAVQP